MNSIIFIVASIGLVSLLYICVVIPEIPNFIIHMTNELSRLIIRGITVV
ncbi:hypothetical protein [Aliarcobacter butzleri]|nr:hypothetical protein [Aliarcobacter butzleri]